MPTGKLGITVAWGFKFGVVLSDTDTKEVLQTYESMSDANCPSFVRKSLYFKFPVENLLL